MQELHIPGFEGQRIAAQVANGANKSQLFVNGQPAPPGPKKGQYLLQRNDGTPATAFFKAGFPDPAPILMVDKEKIALAEPLVWYQWIWAGLPLVLLVMGGAIGGALGAGAMAFNAQIFRGKMNGAVKYVVTALISLAAFVLWALIVNMIRR